MANGTTSFADFARQNPALMRGVTARYQPVRAPAPAVAPAPAPATPPAPPPEVAPVENVTQASNPYAAQARVQDERITGFNQEAASYQREGAAKQQMAQQQALSLDEFNQKVQKFQSDAEANYRANRTQIDEYKRKHAADLETLRKPIPGLSGGKKAASIVAGIVGAMASGGGGFYDPTTGQRTGGGNAGLAMGMNLLQQHVQEGVQRQLDERDMLGRNVKETENAISMLSKDSDDAMETTNKILANQYFLKQRELEKIAKDAEGTAYGENAHRLSLAAADKAREYEEQIINARIKKAEAARRGKKRDPMVAELEAKERAGILTVPEAKALNDLRAQQANIQSTVASTDAARAKAAGAAGGAPAPNGWDVADPALWGSLNDTEKAKFRKADSSMRTFERDATKLDALLAKHGTEAFGEKSKEMASLQAQLLASYKEIKDLGALDNGVIEVVDRALGDPTAWTSGGDSVRAKLRTALDSLRGSVSAQAETSGLAAKTPEADLARDLQRGRAGGAAPSPAADPNAPIPYITAKGARVMLRPEQVQAAEAKGWKPASAWSTRPAPAPAPVQSGPAVADTSGLRIDPDAPDYDEQVRRMQGY
ncbi:MAG: hypothetical protein QM778_33175 [Myxococcales bacterium]